MNDAAGQAAGSLRAARAAVLARPELVGSELREALVEVADRWLCELLGAAEAVALVAVGGYGRREPAAGSDLDLLLLHRGGLDVSELADSLWYPIWDAGVGLDHSVRTVAQAAAVAQDDLKVALGLLDARLVAGDRALSAELHEKAFASWRRGAGTRLGELVEAVRGRLASSGELAFLLEPDLKESRGGLRDVHAMRAIAAAQVADPPDQRVRTAYRLLLDVRGELHRRSGRGGDRLVRQEQLPVASALGFTSTDELMRKVSEAGRVIAFATDESCRRAVTAGRPTRRWSRRGPAVRRPLADGVVEQDGVVHLARDADPARDPVLVLRVAAAAAQADLPIAGRALERLAAQSSPIPEPWPHAARDALVATLGAGPSAIAVFEALDQAGMMVSLLPEWASVRCKPHHNPVHQFTVDRHLIETGVQAAAFTRRVARPDLLLLGALLHDIGKGYPGDHTEVGVAIVPVIATRLGFPPPDVAVLTAMVRHHLLLPHTATRRDLADPETIRTVVEAVGDRSTLDLLQALTEADAVATGPAAWNEWKAALVGELAERARVAMSGEPASDPIGVQPHEVALAERGEVAVEVDGTRVTIVAPDRPGRLWCWAGVLSLHRLEIRSAVAATLTSTSPAMAVAVHEVAPRFGSIPTADALRPDVRRGYDDPAGLGAQLQARERTYPDRSGVVPVPPRVIWLPAASRTASVVEVRAHDSIGLLYRLTRALAEMGLDVQSARVNTLGAEAVDTFYLVGDVDGPLRDPAVRQAVEAALLAACQASG